jgi:hypothetical protein
VLLVKNYCIIILLFLAPQYAMALEVTPEKIPKSGLLTWTLEEPEISLKLAQLLPEFVSAVFSSRGLPPQVVATLKDYCVFGTIIKNKSNGNLAYSISDWRVVTPDGHEHTFKTKDEWAKQWAEMGTPFRWLLLPADQDFGVGDWSQGFTTIELPPDSVFDLKISWSYQGKTHRRTLENLRCAPAQLPASSNGNQTRN